jgi:hypothetical protein
MSQTTPNDPFPNGFRHYRDDEFDAVATIERLIREHKERDEKAEPEGEWHYCKPEGRPDNSITFNYPQVAAENQAQS